MVADSPKFENWNVLLNTIKHTVPVNQVPKFVIVPGFQSNAFSKMKILHDTPGMTQ